jgi:uncharacterized protein YbjT (DUF2867 family)
MAKVFLAGASGALGQRILAALCGAGHEVHALTSREAMRGSLEQAGATVHTGDALRPGALSGMFDGVDVVVSALGASVGLTMAGRASYDRVDVVGNVNLGAEARRSGVERFVYISAHGGAGYEHTRYIRAHYEVEAQLRAQGFALSAIRPTGVFTAFDAFIDMARGGRANLIGDGDAQTNPIDPRDVARAVVEHLTSGPEVLEIGGPEILTRRRIVEKAFEALDKPVRIGSAPASLVTTLGAMTRPFHPRLGDLMSFVAAVSTHDAIAPPYGTHTLGDYYAERARQA